MRCSLRLETRKNITIQNSELLIAKKNAHFPKTDCSWFNIWALETNLCGTYECLLDHTYVWYCMWICWAPFPKKNVVIFNLIANFMYWKPSRAFRLHLNWKLNRSYRHSSHLFFFSSFVDVIVAPTIIWKCIGCTVSERNTVCNTTILQWSAKV